LPLLSYRRGVDGSADPLLDLPQDAVAIPPCVKMVFLIGDSIRAGGLPLLIQQGNSFG
jgi:hypothetical protein